MKKRVFVVLAFSLLGKADVCQAHTEAEEDACVRSLVLAYEGAPENSDCVEIDVPEEEDESWRFPTIDHLFGCTMWHTDVGATWTPEERREAFEHYMSRLSTKDRREMTSVEISTCGFAFDICQRFAYTNCLFDARGVLENEYAPEKRSALYYLYHCSEPSIEMNEMTLFVVTNMTAFSNSERYFTLKTYCQKMAQIPSSSPVFTNALERFVSRRAQHRLYRPLDTILLASDSAYETSTNRYALAVEALQYTNPTSQNADFFRSITNRFHNCGMVNSSGSSSEH